MGIGWAVLLLLGTFMEQQSLSHCLGEQKSSDVPSLVSQLGLCFLPSLQPLGQSSMLLQYRESGLSSSSSELSQYIHDSADHYDSTLSGTWSPAQAGEV